MIMIEVNSGGGNDDAYLKTKKSHNKKKLFKMGTHLNSCRKYI